MQPTKEEIAKDLRSRSDDYLIKTLKITVDLANSTVKVLKLLSGQFDGKTEEDEKCRKHLQFVLLPNLQYSIYIIELELQSRTRVN